MAGRYACVILAYAERMYNAMFARVWYRYGGLDLSSSTDITAFVLVFPPLDEDDKYIVLPYFWIPEDTMYKFCCGHPECDYQDGRGYYGVRLDTGKYSYLMRFNPNKGEYNLYCYCYQKDWLDDHIKNAESGIRFIDPHYNNLFVIPDGGKVKVTFDNGKYIVHKCRYIDQYHVEIDGSRIYHICEFAEIMQKYGCTVNPVAENE